MTPLYLAGVFAIAILIGILIGVIVWPLEAGGRLKTRDRSHLGPRS